MQWFRSLPGSVRADEPTARPTTTAFPPILAGLPILSNFSVALPLNLGLSAGILTTSDRNKGQNLLKLGNKTAILGVQPLLWKQTGYRSRLVNHYMLRKITGVSSH